MAVRRTLLMLVAAGVLVLASAVPASAYLSGGTTAPPGDTPGSVKDPADAGGTSYGTGTEAEREAAARARARARAKARAEAKARALAKARAKARAKERARKEREKEKNDSNNGGGGGGGGGYSEPLKATPVITSLFYEKRSYENHPGVDLAIDSGTPIYAIGAGTVTQAGSNGGYGNYTCIAHTSTMSSCYAHQSSILVSEGDSVSKGQLIGKVGTTGNSTGPHLHFEIRVNGDVVCPAPWVGVASSKWCASDAPGYGSTSRSVAAARTASVWKRIAPPKGDAAD